MSGIKTILEKLQTTKQITMQEMQTLSKAKKASLRGQMKFYAKKLNLNIVHVEIEGMEGYQLR